MVNQRHKGIICIVLSALFFALMSTFVRLSGDLPTMQKTFFRNFVALFFAVWTLKRKGIKFEVSGRDCKLAIFVRALAGTVGMIGNFYAVDHLMLSDASMLNKMSPFFAVVFSFIILKERLAAFEILTVAGAFLGSLFIIKPSFSNVEIFPALAGFVGGAAAGLAYACVRYLGGRGVKGAVIVAFFSAFSCLVTLPFMIFAFKPMSAAQLAFLLAAGAAAAAGQFSITAAYTYAPAREISVYDYSQLIFTTLIGFFLFGDIPDGWSFLGYAIIVLMAVLVFIRSNRLHEKNSQHLQEDA